MVPVFWSGKCTCWTSMFNRPLQRQFSNSKPWKSREWGQIVIQHTGNRNQVKPTKTYFHLHPPGGRTSLSLQQLLYSGFAEYNNNNKHYNSKTCEHWRNSWKEHSGINAQVGKSICWCFDHFHLIALIHRDLLYLQTLRLFGAETMNGLNWDDIDL